MKKFIITLLMLMLCVSTALFTASCGEDQESSSAPESIVESNTESVIESESTAESESVFESESESTTESEIVDEQSFIEFKTLTVDGLTVYGKVSNATVDFSFIEEINLVGGADFIVALDSYGTQTVITKKVPLAEGDNTFYVFETTGGKLVKTYVVTVRRRPLYRVTFNTDGGSAVATQYVEEDFLATQPTTEKVGCDFVSWNYNFNEPITRDTVVTAQFEIKPEMSNFNFTSTATTCTVTGLKDKTVTEIIVPDYVTSIGDAAFAWCNSLTSVVIGDGVTSIGDAAFYDCNSLTSVVIGNGVTSIGDAAFFFCNSLTSVVIGDGVTTIGDYAFQYCFKLVEVVNKSTHFTVTKGSTGYGFLGCYALAVYNSGDAYISKLSNDGDYIIYTDGAEKILVGYKGAETDLVLPSYITEINQYAFYNCDSLTSVVIGDGVTTIGDWAFYNCDSLTSVVIGDGVTTIGDFAFDCCYKLVEVVNKSTHFTVTKGSAEFGYLGYYALAVYNSGDAYISKFSNDGDYIIYTDGAEKILVGYNGAETNLVLPSYITKINEYAFSDCDSLTSVVIGDGVTSIGYRAFYDCDSLTSVVIGDGATSIGDYAFSSCHKLVEVVNKSTHFTVTKGSTDYGYLGYYALAVYNSGSGITESQLLNDNGYIIYTDGAEKILVGYNGAETDLVLPSYITKINQYAFYACDSLTSVVIPDNVTTIGKYAFYYCSSLTSVVIGNSVTSIGDYAFDYCRSLTSVYYKGTASEWSGISIESYNTSLTNATRYYYSEAQPTASGNYWHYDEDGNVAHW